MAATAILVDTITLLDTCLADISSDEVTKLAIDLEGVDLCRYGKLSILQVIANTSKIIWLVDVTVLGALAFSHVDADGRSLKAILESERTEKDFYDVRNDADALDNLYGIRLANVYDLQLLEVAVRRSANLNVKLVSGLAKTIEVYLDPQPEWQRVKEAGVALFLPQKGGSFEVFERRPLDKSIIAYCAQDVALLFHLEATLESRIGPFGINWKQRVLQASASRVAEARNGVYSGQGKHRAIASKF